MKLHSFLTCIASLALCDPVAGASSWAFDPGSCSQRYLAVLEPALERATTIAKNTNTWLPNNPALTRSKPQFAKALLGSSYTKYARSVFGGGKIGWRGVNIDIPGIADFTAQMQWTDPSLWGSNLNNLAVYCNAENVEGFGSSMINRVSRSFMGGSKPPCGTTYVPNSAMLISHYDETSGVNYWFICPWWLEQMASAPKMWDTRTTIYNMRKQIISKGWTLDQWRPWRNQQLLPQGSPYTGQSDSFLSAWAVDILLLNALMHTWNGGLRLNNAGGENSVYPSLTNDWSNLVNIRSGGASADAAATLALPYTFIAIAVFGYQTGFDTDLTTGNYKTLRSFDTRDDFGSPDGLYHEPTGPDPPPYQGSAV